MRGFLKVVRRDDAKREYAYGRAHALPDSKVGRFTQALYDEAKKDRWLDASFDETQRRLSLRQGAWLPTP